LCRDPDGDEVRLGVAFAAAEGGEAPRFDAWAQLAQVLLLTNELMFVD
jgi:hypothetical protein